MKSMSVSRAPTELPGSNILPLGNHGRAGDSPPPSAYEIARRQLSNLQAQAARLATAIEAAAGETTGQPGDRTAATLEMVRATQQARLDRIRYFPPQLFTEPGWDMLLELYAAQLGDFEVSIASLCIASNAPATVALECLSALEREGLVERRPDPIDERRFSLALTERAGRAFKEYFASLPRGAVAP